MHQNWAVLVGQRVLIAEGRHLASDTNPPAISIFLNPREVMVLGVSPSKLFVLFRDTYAAKHQVEVDTYWQHVDRWVVIDNLSNGVSEMRSPY